MSRKRRNIFSNLGIDSSISFINDPDTYNGSFSSPQLVDITPNKIYTLESVSIKYYASFYNQTPVVSSILNAIQGGLILFLTNSNLFSDLIKVNFSTNPPASPPTTSGGGLQVSDVVLSTNAGAGGFSFPYLGGPLPTFAKIPVTFGDSIIRIFPTHSNFRQDLSSPIVSVDTNFQDSLNVVFRSYNYRYLGIGFIPFSNFPISVNIIPGNGLNTAGSLFFGANLIESNL